MKKLLFYILFFIGLAGCGQKGTNLPDKIKVYQIYEYDNSYGMEEQLPFGGLRGEVKQIVNHIENGGTETYTFHRNGLIDEISTDVFDAESARNDNALNIFQKFCTLLAISAFFRINPFNINACIILVSCVF